jgi:hypothetical protein
MTVTTATKTSRPRAISGWPLDHLISLDALYPGILRFAFQASSLRRQGIFLTLSHLRPGSPEDLAARLARSTDLPASPDPLATIATALVTLRVRDLVQALHPGVDGLVGALNRIGDNPLHPLKYRTLVRMLREPDQRRARVLKQVEVISETTLSVLRVLDPTFLYPDIVKRFRSTASVQAFNAAVDLIRRVVPSVTDEDLLASLKALGPTSGLDTWAQRWVTKAEFPILPPIQDDEDWRVLRTGEAMAEAGQRFRNCIKGRVALVALGRAAYVEWRSEPAIIELLALSGPQGSAQYTVDGIHGPRNGRVAPAAIEAICAKATSAGLLIPAKLGHARTHNEAARLLNVYEFDAFQGLRDPAEEAVDEILDEITREAA